MPVIEAAGSAARPSTPELEPGELTLAHVAAFLIGIRKFVLAGVVVGLVGAVLYLHLVTFQYTARLVVTPVEASSGGLPGNLSGLAAMAGINLPQTDGASAFNRYLAGLQSRAAAVQISSDESVMRRVFASRFDPITGQWKPPAGPIVSLATVVKSALAVPDTPWSPPAAADLQQFLEQQIEVVTDRRTSITTITFRHEDPVFAAYFLRRLHQVVEDVLRQQSIERAENSIAYLEQQLQVVELAEHRSALAEMLSEQAKARMLAKSGAPYAAEPFGDVAVSSRPTEPKPAIVLAGGLVAGLVLGVGFGVLWRVGGGIRSDLKVMAGGSTHSTAA